MYPIPMQNRCAPSCGNIQFSVRSVSINHNLITPSVDVETIGPCQYVFDFVFPASSNSGGTGDLQFQIGSVSTLPAGSNATASVSQSGNMVTLSLGIPHGAQGPQGEPGEQGPPGEDGENATITISETITGAPGTNASVENLGTETNAVLQFTIPQGQPGSGASPSSTALNAQNQDQELITVVLGGTAIDLPIINYNNGLIPIGTDTFQVNVPGTYYFEYTVSTTVGLLMRAGINRNGTIVPSSVDAPAIAANEFNMSGMLSLGSGEQIQLVLYGLASVVTLADGVGASLSLIRII